MHQKINLYLLAHPALTYCCAASCCDLDQQLPKFNRGGRTTQKPNLGLTYTYGPPGHFQMWSFEKCNSSIFCWRAGLGSGLASPRLWTSLLGFIVVLLAIFMIFQVALSVLQEWAVKEWTSNNCVPQNLVSFKRAKKILPLLQKESSGPYSDTTVKDGIILPKVRTDFQLSQNWNFNTLAQVTYREDVAEGGREDGKPNQVSIEFKPTMLCYATFLWRWNII